MRSNSRSSILTPRSSLPIPGIIPSRHCSGPSRRTCRICSRKSSRPNSCLRSLRSSSAAWSVVVGVLGLLDQGHHVAHPEDPLSHPVRVEALELVELLAGRREHDRLAGDRLDRQRGAAASVAVELGHARRRRSRPPRPNSSATLTASWPVIASTTSRMSCGRTAFLMFGQLRHQLAVDVQAAAGVDDQHVLALADARGRAPRRRS